MNLLDVAQAPDDNFALTGFDEPAADVVVRALNRVLDLGIRDSGLVEVISGIVEGERVVTKGGYIVKLSSLSSASFGAGHGH